MSKQLVKDSPQLLRSAINGAFANREPWQIVAITTTTFLSTVWLWNLFINQDESLFTRVKKRVYKLSRKIPYIQNQIDDLMGKLKKDFENDMLRTSGKVGYTTQLPFDALSETEILSRVEEHLQLGTYNYKDGHVSGGVYTINPQLIALVKEVYGMAAYSNPMHADVFPGVCKMEAEVLRMVANLFHGGPEVCGTMTTGGTESILMAVKAYRDFARDIKGIKRPNIVIPRTAHSAFDKAGQYFKVHVNYAMVDPVTLKVNLKAMEKAINKNTIMVSNIYAMP